MHQPVDGPEGVVKRRAIRRHLEGGLRPVERLVIPASGRETLGQPVTRTARLGVEHQHIPVHLFGLVE